MSGWAARLVGRRLLQWPVGARLTGAMGAVGAVMGSSREEGITRGPRGTAASLNAPMLNTPAFQCPPPVYACVCQRGRFEPAVEPSSGLQYCQRTASPPIAPPTPPPSVGLELLTACPVTDPCRTLSNLDNFCEPLGPGLYRCVCGGQDWHAPGAALRCVKG